MSALWTGVRYALRTLCRNPGFASAAILALALGIGATTAIFSVLDAALLRPLPYPQPDRLMWVGITFPSLQTEIMPGADYVEWSEQNRVFTGMAAMGGNTDCDIAGGGEPERINCGRVTANFFKVTGIAPVLGRGFLPAEDQPNGPGAIVLGHGLWLRRFGGDRGVLGRSLSVSGEMHTIVGVMPEEFRMPGQVKVDALIAQKLDRAAQLNRRQMRILRTIARLKPGASPEQARANLNTLLDNDRRRFPLFYRRDNQVRVIPLKDHEAGNIRLTLLILLGAVGCVLLIACANVANLLLARAAARTREIAIRTALGAGRGTLARQLLTESAVLGLLGGCAGLLLAAPALRALVWLAPSEIPRIDTVSVNGSVLAFTFALALLTGLLFGIAPVFVLGRSNVNDALKQGGGRAVTPAGGKLRAALVIGELALSLMLVAGAALLIESLWKLQQSPLGFEPEQVLASKIVLSRSHFPDLPRQARFWSELLERVERIPGIEAVGLAGGVPPRGGISLVTFSREGAPLPEPGHRGDNVVVDAVSPGYFRALEIPLRRGRVFDEHDNRDGPRVGIVNEALVRRYFPNENPIGKRIMYMQQAWKTIVGVVGDVKNDGLQGGVRPEMYQPWPQSDYMNSFELLVRSAGKPQNLAGLVRGQIRAINPDTPLTFRTVQDDLSALTVRPRFQTIVFSSFAIAALLLAAVGTYGVLAYAVAQRTQEIGIRMALGAAPRQVVNLVAGQALRMTGAGIAIGVAGACLANRYLRSLLFEVQPNDPIILGGVALLLAATAAAASWLPARRAARVDPVIALRAE